MKLVENFVRDEPAVFEASRSFVRLFENVPDPVLYVAGKAKTLTAKIAWVILGTTLFQDRSYSEIVHLLNNLYEKFPDEKLWTLPVPRAQDIEEIVESTFHSRYWSLFENVAGIFWSVGFFVRRHDCNLEKWLNDSTPEEVWRDLGEVYFMGKGNPRPKACAAFYRMVSLAPLGLGVSYKVVKKMLPLPLTMGARRYLAFLGPAKEENFSDMDADRKQSLANDLFCMLDSESPYRAAHSLQFFLEMGSEDFVCRERTNHCANCPLFEFCGYADHGEKK